jgi:hypothetical protein
MNLTSKLKSVFVQPLSCLTLSLLTVTSTLPFVLAETSYPQQPQRLAQLGDREQLERSRLIQEANVLYSQGNFTGAEENLRKLIKKFPKDAFGYYQLGMSFINNAKPKKQLLNTKKLFVSIRAMLLLIMEWALLLLAKVVYKKLLWSIKKH